jgi:hypothetical protein
VQTPEEEGGVEGPATGPVAAVVAVVSARRTEVGEELTEEPGRKILAAAELRAEAAALMEQTMVSAISEMTEASSRWAAEGP